MVNILNIIIKKWRNHELPTLNKNNSLHNLIITTIIDNNLNLMKIFQINKNMVLQIEQIQVENNNNTNNNTNNNNNNNTNNNNNNHKNNNNIRNLYRHPKYKINLLAKKVIEKIQFLNLV